MTDEEKKAQRAAYMVNYRKNLSKFQKEKRRLQNSTYRKKLRMTWTTEQLEKERERNHNYYLNNLDKLKAYMAEYRLKQKEKKCLQNEKEKN
jgi:uncharacterized protein YcbK (DUF882 family)